MGLLIVVRRGEGSGISSEGDSKPDDSCDGCCSGRRGEGGGC